MSRPLRLGIVGAGFTGRQAALSASQMERVESAAIADPDSGRRDPVADEFAIPGRCADYRELLSDGGVDAVYLGVPPDIRRPMVLDSLAAGKHVLVQKPHATRAGEILEMDAAAQDAGRVVQFCYYLRHYPHNRAVRLAVDSGTIGEPYHGRYFSKNASPPGTITAANRWLHVYGQKGGVLAQHMSHDLNLLWWWMGSPQPQWAFAAKHHLHPLYDGPEGPSEDYFSGLLGFAGGRTIQIDCSNSSHCDTPRTCELHGTGGAIAGNARCGLGRAPGSPPNEAVFRRTGDGYRREEIPQESDVEHAEAPEGASPFYHEIERFAMAVAGETEPEVAAPEAHLFMKILDALYDSADTGRKIEIR